MRFVRLIPGIIGVCWLIYIWTDPQYVVMAIENDETNHLLDFFPILLTDFPGFGIKTISPYFKGQPYPAKSSSKSPRVMSDNILPDPLVGLFGKRH